MKKALLTFVVATLAYSLGWSQITFNTVPPLNGGNGSGGTAFQVTANANIIITGFNAALQSSSQNIEIWYSTTDLTGPPNITTPAWTQLGSASVTGASTGLTPVITQLPIPVTLLMNAGTTYRFYIGCSSCSVVYTTFNSANGNPYSDGNITIETGTNVGYGGSIPNPTFHPRQFNGGVRYTLASGLDLAMTSIVGPSSLQVGNNILQVQVTNSAADTIDSADIAYSFNGGATVLTDNFTFPSPLGPGGTYTYTFPTPFNVPSNGTYGISTWVADVNGIGTLDSNSANDTIMDSLCTGLAGSYTIDGAVATGGSNFQTFNDAVAALSNCGITDTVVFNVAAGTYNEQVSLVTVLGASPTSPIYFNGMGSNATMVDLTYASINSADNYTVKFDGADWFNFSNMTISNTGTTWSHVIDINGGSDSNTIEDCIIAGDLNTTTTSTNKVVIWSNNGLDNYNTFRNNEIRGGSYGMYWYGSNTTTLEEGTVIENNLFTRQYYYGIRSWYTSNMKFRDNVFSTLSTYTGTSYGFYFFYADNEFECTGNRVEANTLVPRYGIYMANCDGTATQQGLVANNAVHVGDSANGSAFYGIYMSNSGYQNVVHNSVAVEGTSTTGRGLWIPSGGANKVLNNIMANFGNGYACYISNTFAVTQMDNNAFYTNGSNVGFFNGNQATLSDWQAASGFDLNSYETDPQYYDYQANDLHICNDTLDNTGADISPLVLMDFDGEMRTTSSPDIGADEFTSITGFSLGADTTTICMGDTLTLVGVPGAQNIWSTLDSTVTLDVSSVGTWSVDVTNNCGTSTDTINTVMNTAVSLPATANICANQSTTLDAVLTNSTYNWSTSETTQSITVSGPGVYSVMVVDQFGCTSMDSTIITQSVDTDIQNDTMICTGDQLVLDAGLPGSTYAWTPGGQTGQTVTVNSSGTYGVTVTDQFNCVSTDQMVLTTLDAPVAGFSTTVAFLTAQFTNSSVGGTTQWFFGDGQSSTLDNPVHIYPQQGTFVALQVVSNMCGTDSLFDTINTSVVGISQVLSEGTMAVYPNPSQGEFTLEMENVSGNSVTYTITAIDGRVVAFENILTNSGSVRRDLSLAEQGAGVYFLKVETASGSVIRKLVVE